MAKAASGKKKATVWYDRVVELKSGGVAVFARVQKPVCKRERRGF